MALAIGRLRTNVRKSRMGGTPGGIIASRRSATSPSKGGSTGSILGMTTSWCFGIRNKDQGNVSEIETQARRSHVAGRPPPRPGQEVRGSTTGRPLMAAMDLLGRRWALRILWELRDGPTGARALRVRCDGMSSSVLYDRLHELMASGLIAQRNEEYVLSDIGAALGAALKPLDAWAETWSATLLFRGGRAKRSS